MGCATSKPKVCQNCHTQYSPVRRSYSMYIPQKKDHHHRSEEQHLVNLTSTTLGSLKLDSIALSQSLRDDDDRFSFGNNVNETNNVEELLNEAKSWSQMIDDKIPKVSQVDSIIVPETQTTLSLRDNDRFSFENDAKTWSQMINEKIPKVAVAVAVPVPKTPVRTPPGEPETINAWELMEGLEDITPLKPVANHHDHSFSFPVSPNAMSSFDREDERFGDPGSPKLADNECSLHSNDTSFVSEFDPEVISSFRKALEELPPANPFHLKPLILDKLEDPDDEVEPVNDKTKENGEILTGSKLAPRGMEKLVIYFTSLRGVRKTYEDCCHVRVILKGLGVKVDERDVSMHSGFKEELKELLGIEYAGGGLPRVFLGKKYIGGADEIRRMNEDGKLEKLVESCERLQDGTGSGGGIGNGVCEACGDIRFVPCETCSGSCKIFYEAEFDELEVDEDEFGFQRCPDCNENGLIRCPICCD